MIDYSVLTTEMVLSDNLVPTKYAGKDVRLFFSKENEAFLGFWLAAAQGHQRVSLKKLIEHIGGKPYLLGAAENKEIAELIKTMPVAYYREV